VEQTRMGGTAGLVTTPALTGVKTYGSAAIILKLMAATATAPAT
jgi:hypothetical protein